jgi:hypothetical protein
MSLCMGRRGAFMTESITSPDRLRWWQKLTRWEILLSIVAVIAVLIALLLPPVQWASDGTRVLPVRVFVFDPDSGQPIPGAKVFLSRGLGMFESTQGPEIAGQFGSSKDWSDLVKPDQQGITNNEGLASVNFEFRVTASNLHPQPKLSPAKCWIRIEAPGYGTAMVTPGSIVVEVQKATEAGGFLVPVGLSKIEN